MIPGALEAFAPLRILSRIPTASTSAGVELVKRALVAGGEEAAQEAASGFAQNLIAKGVYKPDQELIDGLGEQAAYGGATGAIVQGLMDLALGRRARGSQTTPAETPPQLPPQAPAGTQGTLFGEEEMGKRVAAETQPTPPAHGVEIPAGQQDLGLDFQREYADMLQERERLKQAEQTDEVKARVKELTEQMALYTQSDIESLRAEKEAQAAAAKEDAAARKKFPALTAAPDLLTLPDEVKARTQMGMFPGEDLAGPTLRETGAPTVEKPIAPTPVPAYQRTGPYQYKLPLRGGEAVVPFTMKDIEDTGIAPSTTKGWFEQNVVGKTTSEVQALVDKDPTLLDGKGKRAKILRELLAPQPAPFKEAPRVEQTPTATPAVEQRAEPGAGEPSVGVPSEPAPAELTEPGAGVPPTAAAPVTPDGLGLVPAGQSAVPGAAPQGAEPTAVEAETPEQEAARKQEAAELEARLRSVGAPTRVAPAAIKPAAPAPAKAPSAPIPEKMYEPTGTSEFGMEEGQKEILRGPQAMLFPMSKREELEYAERAKPETEAGAEDEAPAAAAKDERQAELDLRAPRKSPAKKAAPAKSAPAQPAAIAPTDDITRTADAWGGDVMFFDGNVGIIKRPHPNSGELQYVPIRADGTFARNLFGVQSVDVLQAVGQNKVFSPAEMATLIAQTARFKSEESAAEAKFPDGPFTGATSNVVAGASVDPRYTSYLKDLMKSMGLGDVRVFLYHSADVAGNAEKLHVHGSFYPIMARGVADETQKGGTRSIGPEGKDFMLFVKDGMSEAETLEIMSHELGHMIQQIAFDTAPANVQAAIRDAHDDWLDSLKGKTVEDLLRSLRNRAAAEMVIREAAPATLQMPISKLTAKDRTYWMGFGEWFADNVSRWATTADKPLTITEKFFSKVGQMMRDLVAVVTGRKYPPQKLVAEFLDAMGPGSADAWLAKTHAAGQAVQPIANAVSFSTESLIDSMGPMEAQEKSGLRKLIDGYKDQSELGYAVKFRTQVADSAATIEHRLREQFDGAVKDKLGKLNPMGLYRQAQDYSKMLLEYLQVGAMAKEPATGLWKVKADAKVRPPVEVYAMIDAWAAKNGYSRERGTQIASRILEGVRLDAMRTANKNDGAGFLLHLKDAEIDQLVSEYKADPELQAMSKAMDEARLAMVDNMVAVGRLSAEQGKAWKDVAGYVPFDRIEDFATSFTKIKKVSNKGLAQVGKLPELVGSINRPVGNVFDNYLNTLGWMVGQTLKTDGTVQTLRSLEDAGHAKFIGRSPQGKDNVVGMYVKGEMMYWEVPSKYDVLAFKDLNPPKAKWLQVLGQASNVLRKAVTALPPFALKQVTDDVQRAIMTSGVKNPGALLRMTLTNFGGLALAELRGIQHPSVRQFGALGLTGEYDFQQGKPATSVLKDLGYRPRGKFETLLHRLDGITRASDLAVRKAIYDQTLKESNDELLAQTRAREFINFRRRGASDFVGAMVTTIPFFNAYIQGMDVLYRAASGKDSSSSVGRAQARRMFWSRAAIVMALSSLYAMGAGDDEDYQEMDLRTRDSNWILPGGLKIPVPTELGALFKVIPERVVEYMRRQGTPEEQTAWEATRTALAYIMEQYVGRTVPVPQGVKPLLEAWTNYSFFTGRELEGIYQKQQDPSLRRASNTSELAIAISEFSRDVIGVDKVSPIMIDNALNGYFGSTAGLLVAATDSLLNPTRVDRPLHKWALVSNYMYDPVGTRRMTEFYEEREKVGRANTTLAELMKTDLDKAAAYAEAHADELMLESAVNSTLEQLERTRAYRKYLNSAAAAEGMTKDEREATIKEVKQMEVSLTGWLREARTAMRQ
jgi:polyhydroxyalkanoate synthesis regulator phasin